MAVKLLKRWQVPLPSNYRQAMASPYKDEWWNAMKVQISKLEARKCWIKCRKPEGIQVLPGKWVYDVKSDENNIVVEFRARWVVCGNFQSKRPGQSDDDQKYAPVISDASIKLIFTKIAKLNLFWE